MQLAGRSIKLGFCQSPDPCAAPCERWLTKATVGSSGVPGCWLAAAEALGGLRGARLAWIACGMTRPPMACSSMDLAIPGSSRASIVDATTQRERCPATRRGRRRHRTQGPAAWSCPWAEPARGWWSAARACPPAGSRTGRGSRHGSGPGPAGAAVLEISSAELHARCSTRGSCAGSTEWILDS